MTGALVVLMPIASAGFLAAAARLRSLVSTLLVAYLALVTLAVGGVLVLSPTRDVHRGGLALVEGLALVAAVAVWFARGRPGFPLAGARAAVSEVLGRPETALFLVAIAVLLVYELVLALTVPPNNYDSLTYHLARVAAWVQHGGYFWVPNAPTDRINEFQPLAEQQIFFLFAATGSTVLYALPQYAAELAILVAVYGTARRARVRGAPVGLRVLPARDLHADRPPGDDRPERPRGRGLPDRRRLPAPRRERRRSGARRRGGGVRARGEADDGARAADPRCCSRCCGGGARRVLALGGALVAFAAVGMWGYVLNHDHTGKLLGHGQGRIENTTSPSWPGTGVTALFLVYETMDRGGAHEPGGALARGDRHRRGDRRRRLGADAPPPWRGGVGGGGRRAAVRVGAARDRRRLGALLALGSLGTSDSPAEGDRRAAQLRLERGHLGLRPARRGPDVRAAAADDRGRCARALRRAPGGAGGVRAALRALARARVEVERVPDAVPRGACSARRAAPRLPLRPAPGDDLVRCGCVFRRAADDRARDGEAAQRAAVELHAGSGARAGPESRGRDGARPLPALGAAAGVRGRRARPRRAGLPALRARSSATTSSTCR